jgi:2-C-methyl-D-erythritol 2,4-cyclodiphosphate synthase
MIDSPWRVGQGWDIHRLEPGRRLILGGVEIEHDRGLVGHSDADVLTHAVIDALLGASAGGDIGTLFPDSDPVWTNAASLGMLAAVVGRLRSAGWRIGNVDATVIAQEPRIAPYRDRIRERLAGVLGVGADRVSLKAKTAEGLGAEGAGQAISAQAVVVLMSPLAPTSSP